MHTRKGQTDTNAITDMNADAKANGNEAIYEI